MSQKYQKRSITFLIRKRANKTGKANQFLHMIARRHLPSNDLCTLVKTDRMLEKKRLFSL